MYLIYQTIKLDENNKSNLICPQRPGEAESPIFSDVSGVQTFCNTFCCIKLPAILNYFTFP